MGLRRIRVGIYDHAGHFTGGGQRYMADLAALIQDRYDNTPKEVIFDSCIMSPDEEIESIKEEKQAAKTLKLKIQRNISQTRTLIAHGKVEG